MFVLGADKIMGQLTDQVAVITGGAGGIGAAITRLFAQEGAAVVILDLPTSSGEKIATELNETGCTAHFIATDVTRSTDLKKAVDDVLEQFGKITVLMNAVGVLRQGRVDEMDEEDWDFMMNVNVKGVFLATKHVVPALKAAGGGAIVNLSSVSAFVGSDGSFAYTVTKGAVQSMTFGIAQELAPFNIRVNALCPGWVDAGFTQHALQTVEDPAALRNIANSSHAMGRMAKPEEVAQGALFLASSSASFVTGSALFVDGGFMIKR